MLKEPEGNFTEVIGKRKYIKQLHGEKLYGRVGKQFSNECESIDMVYKKYGLRRNLKQEFEGLSKDSEGI